MRVREIENAKEFKAQIWQWLSRNDQLNNMIMLVCQSSEARGVEGTGWIANDGDAPQAAAFRTPPLNAVLSAGTAPGIRALAGAIPPPLPGVVGPEESVTGFADAWCARHALCQKIFNTMTFYICDRLVPFARPPGRLEVAGPSQTEDLVTLTIDAAIAMDLPRQEWASDFQRKIVTTSIAQKCQYIWRDEGQIKSIARVNPGLADRGARIGSVYTPPEFQRRGFGTAITGQITKELLEQRQKWVCLFADAANPTSNAIYQNLGFQPVAKFLTVEFKSG